MTPQLLGEINKARAGRRAVASVRMLIGSEERLVARENLANDPLADVLEKAFRFDQSGIVQTPEGEAFVTVYNPRLHLVIIGAVLIAQAVIPIARAVGFDVTVIDPRGAFATPARFPDVKVMADWPQDVLAALKLDARTGLLALTHDPKIDDPALQQALSSEVFYIGALGSRKTHAARVERLRANGFSEEATGRIAAPIGLAIGAMGASEIAVSIMAEMIQCLRLGN